MKDWKYKVGLIVAGFLLLGALVYIVKLHVDSNKEREALQRQMVEMKQLQDGIVRNQSKYVSKEDLEKFAKEINLNLDPIRKDLQELDAEIKGISHIIARSSGSNRTDLPSSDTTPTDPNVENVYKCKDGGVCSDPYGYLSNMQHRKLNEYFGTKEVPLGEVTFNAQKKQPWGENLFPREYSVSTVISQDEDGRHYVHNKFQIGVDGKKYEVPVAQAELVEKVPEAEFRFDPHVNLGFSVGAGIATSSVVPPEEARVNAEVVAPSLDVSFFSYGETKKNPEVKLLGVGLGFATQETTLEVIVNPVDYNVGKHIPLIDNLYVGPTLGVNIEGDVLIGAGMRVGL